MCGWACHIVFSRGTEVNEKDINYAAMLCDNLNVVFVHDHLLSYKVRMASCQKIATVLMNM